MGWSWDYIEDSLTFPRLRALYRYWGDHPPLHLMVAQYLGIKPENKQKGDLGELLAMFEGGVVK